MEPFARADQVRAAWVDSLDAQAPAGSRQPIAIRCVSSGPGASCASKLRPGRSGSRFQFLNLVHDRRGLSYIPISLPRSTDPPLGSRQSALISVTSVARPRRQPLGRGLHVAGERARRKSISAAVDASFVHLDSTSIRTTPPRTCPTRSDRAQLDQCRAPARSRTRAAGATVQRRTCGPRTSQSWPPRPRAPTSLRTTVKLCSDARSSAVRYI